MDGPDVIENTARAVDYCMRHPQWRLSLQTHKTSASDQFGLLKMWELTEAFRFEAAHALPERRWATPAMEIRGHSFRAEVTIRGTPIPPPGW